jgi:hypothetical protein
MAKTRLLQFKGHHEVLNDGEYYTYVQLAESIGANYNCIKNRLYNKKFVTPEDMYIPNSKRKDRKQPNRRNPEDITRLEDMSMIMMDKYIRRKL